MTEPEEGGRGQSLKPLIYSLLVRSTGDNLGFQLVSDMRDSLVGKVVNTALPDFILSNVGQ